MIPLCKYKSYDIINKNILQLCFQIILISYLFTAFSEGAFSIDDEPGDARGRRCSFASHVMECKDCLFDFMSYGTTFNFVPPDSNLPESFSWIWVEAESFPEAVNPRVHTVDWNIIADSSASGGYKLRGINWDKTASTKRLITIPHAGYYRIWIRYYYRQNCTFLFKAMNSRAITYKYDWQFEPDVYVDCRFAETDYTPSSDWRWESIYAWLPEGEITLYLSSAIHYPPYANRDIDVIVITDDPLADVSLVERPIGNWNNITINMPPTSETASYWPWWQVRPFAPLSGEVDPNIYNLWQQWRSYKIDYLGSLDRSSISDIHTLRLFDWVVFDPRCNGIGKPSQLCQRNNDLAAYDTFTGASHLRQASLARFPALDGLLVWLDYEKLWSGWSIQEVPMTQQLIDSNGITLRYLRSGMVSSSLLFLTNPDEYARDVNITTDTISATWLSVRSTAWLLTKDYGWQPHILLKRSQIKIPGNLTCALWITVDASQLQPGSYHTTINLNDATIPIRINIYPNLTTANEGFFSFGWSKPYEGINYWFDMIDHGINTIHEAIVPQPLFDLSGIKLVSVTESQTLSQNDIDAVVSTIKSAGLTYDQWAWRTIDEPGDDTYEDWIATAQSLRTADANIQIYCNPGWYGATHTQAIESMSPYIDVFCPYVDHFFQSGYHRTLIENTGTIKLLYTTPCYEDMKASAPQSMAELGNYASQYNRGGMDFFSMANFYEYYDGPWNDTDALYVDQSVRIFPSAHRYPIWSRSYEAYRSAIQKFKYGTEPSCGDQSHPYLSTDLNNDCIVNFEDFCMFINAWNGSAEIDVTIDIPWTQGTMINNMNPNTNYSGRWDMQLVWDTSGQRNQGLWNFDMSLLSGILYIKSVELHYYDYYQFASPTALPLYSKIHKVLKPWDEFTTTWNSFYDGTGYYYNAEVLGTMPFEQVDTYRKEVVLSSPEMVQMVQDWIDNPANANGLLLQASDKTVGWWMQTTNNWLSPFLRVTYSTNHPDTVGDLNGDSRIDFSDLALIAASWLNCTHPSGCIGYDFPD